mmetsp:Transcript_31226/g.44340  ORF Transcript_31226/g.44340 Transcript_31226/m.44340 type:complete len:93 (-) Transcript_31226:8-286(-)
MRATGKNIVDINCLKDVHIAFYIDFVDNEKVQLYHNLRGYVKSMGQALCGDVKLFRITGRNLYVYQFLSKLAMALSSCWTTEVWWRTCLYKN